MAACRAAVHLTTVDVCAIRSHKILSCGLPAAVRYAPKLARIMPFCPFPRGIASQTEGGGQQLKMPCLLCILFYDALSHHAYVFLLVSVNFVSDLPTQEEMPPQKEMPPHEEMPTQSRMATQEEKATQDDTAERRLNSERPSKLSIPKLSPLVPQSLRYFSNLLLILVLSNPAISRSF